MPNGDDERELQVLLRNAAAVVLLLLLTLIVIVVLVTPFITDRSVDTTLLLGLSARLCSSTTGLPDSGCSGVCQA